MGTFNDIDSTQCKIPISFLIKYNSWFFAEIIYIENSNNKYFYKFQHPTIFFKYLSLYFCLQLNAEFSQKLKKCAESLLVQLDSNLQHAPDRDHDYSIYTGTAGIALLFYNISFLQNTKKFLKVRVPFLAGAPSLCLLSSFLSNAPSHTILIHILVCSIFFLAGRRIVGANAAKAEGQKTEHADWRRRATGRRGRSAVAPGKQRGQHSTLSQVVALLMNLLHDLLPLHFLLWLTAPHALSHDLHIHKRLGTKCETSWLNMC